MNKNQFFILLIIIALYLVYNDKKIESFDLLERNMTLEKCGRICTKSKMCKGFAFDNKNCYLSINPILGPPSGGKYQDKYSSELFRCNKIKPYTEKDVIPDNPDTRKKYNSVYLCSPTEEGNYEFYQFVNEKVKKLEKGAEQQIENLPEEDYVFEELDWLGYNLTPLEEEEEILSPYQVYIKDDKENLGQYMLPHKCVKDISLQDCIETCNNYKSCKGVEWNPQYKEDKNVCCPKIKIVRKIDRRSEMKNGNFYKKTQSNDLNKKSTYVKIT